MSDLSPEQLERYSRQIVLPEVGGRGQKRLLAARVLVVGVGGLGSPALLYLAAAGVGTLVLADGDRVALSNLQRQIAHQTEAVAEKKTASARRAAEALNPDVTVLEIPVRLGPDSIDDAVARADVVLDGSDNFPTRFLVNEACVRAGKPLVSGAIVRFEGQIAVYTNAPGNDGPCYQCLFPEPPAEGLLPGCQEAGVLGAVAGMVGSLMAAEAIKVLLGIGPGAPRLLHLDVLEGVYTPINVQRRPNCPVCARYRSSTE